MEPRPDPHPEAEILREFAQGKLDNATASQVRSHLDSCTECCHEVSALSGDRFPQRPRPTLAPEPIESVTQDEHGPQPPPAATVVMNLPLELAADPRYEVLRELGRGGMGIVYLARNRRMDRLEVLKIVHPRLLD